MKAAQDKRALGVVLATAPVTALVTACLAASLLGCAARETPRPATVPAPASETRVSVAAEGLPTFLAVADIHLDRTATSVAYGQDTGRVLWRLARDEMAALLSGAHPPRFALFLGDLPVHQAKEHGNPVRHRADIQEVLGGLARLAHDHWVAMVYVPGNNDSLAGDYCPFSQGGRSPLSLSPGQGWPLAGGHGACDPGAGNRPCILSEDEQWGWFSAYPLADDGSDGSGGSDRASLRVVALNTVILSTATYCDDELADAERREVAERELAWLEDQLADAERRGERVLVAMHVFPGRDGYSGKLAWRALEKDGETIQDRFLATLLRHREVVAAVMTAHSHTEEIRRLCDREGPCEQDLFGVALSAPGVTPLHDNNPGIKLVAYGPSFAPVDFETSYTRPDGDGWSSYSFRQVTGCPSSQKTILDCVRWLGTERLIAFENDYYDVLSGRSKPRYPERMLDIAFGDTDPAS